MMLAAMLNTVDSMSDMAARGTSLDSVLIVEDEGLLSMTMDDLVREHGATRVEVRRNVESAMEAARTGAYDCAVLDVTLNGNPTYAVADLLAARHIPFFFWTGLTVSDIEERHRSRPMLPKPHTDEQFRAALARALGQD